jgi:hypothetical protein
MKSLKLACFLLFCSIFSIQILRAQVECKVLVPALDGDYDGKCKNGLAHGKGVARGIDTYTGTFRKGIPHGKGKYEWSTGEFYEGDWRNGLREGEGVYVFKINERDTTLAGLWEQDKYMGPKPEKPKIMQKYNIDRVTFYRQGDGGKVELEFYLAGAVNGSIENLSLVGSSGSEFSMGRTVGFQNVEFPFECKVIYRSFNTLMTVQRDCSLELKIFQPGSWQVKIYNN